MFRIVVQPTARRQLRTLRSFDAARILREIERHLVREPERPSRSSVKRLRGRQDATCRLRVGDFRIFYDVEERTVTIVAVLHKSETASFYRREDES